MLTNGLRAVLLPAFFTDVVAMGIEGDFFADIFIAIEGDLKGVKEPPTEFPGLKPSCRPQSYPMGVSEAANGLGPERLFELAEFCVTADGV
mmetsp:Transcript_30718/g.57510  ORF Transcript_30718/g.57510 Transcript_30718/m.57510 type:complete len:91 (+) Transcript_30718:278-550(+)